MVTDFVTNTTPLKTFYKDQEKLLKKLTDFIQMYWDETLDLEMGDIIDQCSKSDTDFEFVIDQSGSGTILQLAPGRSGPRRDLNHRLWSIDFQIGPKKEYLKDRKK